MRCLLSALSIVLLSFIGINCDSYAQSGLFIAPNSSPITSPVNGQSWLFNSTNRTVNVFNGTNFQTVSAPFSNFLATNNPTSSNDNTQGYVVGSLWINQTTQGVFICSNAATAAAVWTGINAVVTTIPLNDLQQGGATDGQSLIWNNTAGVWNPANPAISLSQLTQSSATSGQGIIWNGTAWAAANVGSGSVTSFSAGNLSPLFTSSVATATTTPALTFNLSNAAANTILSNATGSSATPAYNSLSVTAGTGLTGGGNLTSNPTFNVVSPFPVSLGGTGAATTSAHTYFGNNTGITATPGFVSLTASDMPSTTVNSVSNTASVLTAAISSQALNLSYSGTALPVANGGTNATTGTAAINNLITGSPSSGQALEFNGTNWVPATLTGTGTVTGFSSGNLSPLFTASVATSSTTPALTYSLSTAGANSILSNTSSSSAAPAYNVLSVTAGTGLNGGGDLTTNPTINLTTPISNSNLGSTVVTSAGSLSPLFTSSVTSQTLGFTLSTVAGHSFFGNNTGTSGSPAYVSIGAGDLPSTTVNTTTNAAPFFTSSITGQALTFSVTNATGNSILSNTSGSPGTPAYNVLTLTAGTGLTGGGNLSSSPSISLSTPVSTANGGTGSSLFSSGQATFATAGSVSVVDSSITSSSIIVVTQVGGTPLTENFSVTVTAGTGFTVFSSNAVSTASVNYIRVK
jgi:trimeric autotransporter adhesin